MEVYVFDKGLNRLGILDNYFSLIWNRKYFKCGDFEIHCPLTSVNLDLLQKTNVIWKNDDSEAGYIEYRSIRMDEQGVESLVVTGRFLTGYLSRRIVEGQVVINDTSENAIRELIDTNAINPTNPDRVIDLLELGQLKNYTQTINMQTSYKPLLDKVEEIAHASELGIRTIFDIKNSKLVFDIYEGLDRTTSQSTNSPAIFSREFENVLSQEYTDSTLNYKNVAIVAGEGEGVDREIEVVGSGIGLDRHEFFVDAGDIKSKEIDNSTIPPAEYTALLVERGQIKLCEMTDIQTFNSEIDLKSNLRYKGDFDLGDKVTCRDKSWGVTINTRIVEVQEIYEPTGKKVKVSLGEGFPTLTDKLKEVI